MLGETLTAIAMLHQLLCVLQGRRPVETMARRCVVPALPLMYLSQQFDPFLRLDALLEDSRYAALVQFTIDDGVCQRTTLKSPSFCFVLRQVPSDEVVGERLRPGWYLPYVEDTGDQGISSL
jgi:hypothetical protein